MGKQLTPTPTPPHEEEQEVMNLLGRIFQEEGVDQIYDDEVPKPKTKLTTTTTTMTTTTTSTMTSETTTGPTSSSLISMGLASAFVIAHGAIILSLPPAIRGKGAPFLPTKSTTMDRMFALIRKQPQIREKLLRNDQLLKSSKASITTTASASTSIVSSDVGMKFVDLGSGDGRMVFRAAKENSLFRYSIGYEINPVLHMFAQARRLVQFPSFYSNTLFYRKDLWKVQLENVDVIAVYGLHPIMDKLGKKMQAEATPGTIVVSNVFSIPGWRPICVEKGIFIYAIPDSLPSS